MLIHSTVAQEWPDWIPRPPWIPNEEMTVRGVPYERVRNVGGGATGQGYIYQMKPNWVPPEGKKVDQFQRKPPQQVFVKKYHSTNQEAAEREARALQLTGNLIQQGNDPKSGRPLLVQPQIPGQRLDHYIGQAAQFSPSELSGMRAGFLGAIDQFHRRGFLHGDLTPQNVMFDPRTGQYHIIDFESLQTQKEVGKRGIRESQQQERRTGAAAFDSIAYAGGRPPM